MALGGQGGNDMWRSAVNDGATRGGRFDCYSTFSLIVVVFTYLYI